MKLLKLIIDNFRQFYGRSEIVFSTDEIKSITLIHGENGTGKTTLLNSVLWCFYGEMTSDFENKNEIINHDAINKGTTSAAVELYFIHNDIKYCAQRKYIYRDGDKLSVFEIDSDGNFGKIISPPSPFIESVIPNQMASYFFFHGEGISSIAKEGNQSVFRRAIRNILGFTAAEYAIQDLKHIADKWNNQLIKLQRKGTEYQRTLQLKTQLENEKNEFVNAKKKREEDIDNYSKQKVILELERTEIKVTDIQELSGKVKKLEADIKGKDLELKAIVDKERLLISRYGLNVFGFELSQQTLSDIEEQDELGVIPAPYDDSLINQLTSKQNCICGRELLPGTEPYNAVLALRQSANTKEIKIRRTLATSYVGYLNRAPTEFIDDWDQISISKNKLSITIQQAKNELEDVNRTLEKLGDGGHKELKAINDKITALNGYIVSNSNALPNLERLISEKTRLISEKERALASLIPDDKNTQKIQSDIFAINELTSLCENKLINTEKNSKLRITKYINDILESFSRKDFKVKLDADFNFHLIRDDGTDTIIAKSKGENLLLNLAFIAALIKFCGLRKNADNKFYIKGTEAPFFIDAPFGELDETYRAATARFLPDSCKQLVLLLSSSHWSGTVDKEISTKVSKEYILVSHKKREQGNKPNDEIIIRGKKYIQSIYSSDFDGSTIIEI